MSLSLDLDVKYAFEVNASYDEVFALLSDVPRASSLHPTLEKIVDLGGGQYRWIMKKYGIEKFNVQTIYTCHYVASHDAGTVTWTPVPGDGNALVEGCFNLTRKPLGTLVSAQISSTATLPIPAIMKKLVLQIISSENKKLNEQYIGNLIRCLGGGRILRI